MNLIKPIAFTAALLVLSFAIQLDAQDLGGLPGAGGDLGGAGGGLEDQIIDMVNDAGGPANTGGGGGGNDGGDFDLDSVIDQNMVEIAPDARQNAGFIGASVVAEREDENRQFRFIGARGSGDGAGAAPRAGTAGGGGGGGGGAAERIRIQRSTPVRARLVPRFSAPRLAPRTVTSRVTTRLNSLPATRQFANSMNVSMQGRTAVISGNARNQGQVNRISRQLRLEPGVSRIVNRVSVPRSR